MLAHKVTARQLRMLYHLLCFKYLVGPFYNFECLLGSLLLFFPIWKVFKLPKIYKSKISHIMGSAQGRKIRPIACV